MAFDSLPTMAEVELERVGKPLNKPSKLERLEKKASTKAAVSKARAKSDKADKARLAAIREACYERDKGQCRACWRILQLLHGGAFTMAHCHHMTYRSAQGSDELSNRCLLCAACHEAEHRHRLQIAGDPNSTLTFTEIDPETGKLKRTWTSVVPS